ncbi:uncharacterized protein TRIVIDRAFT_67754 [Trichoderma virens Gv29-8]|uniref:Uncharacterized protein n=1 Tax=Hypocrea virens (strain Gv29-8 / FGSC 10586) TaxID=413071 RepID=G9MQR4_HYPVG|nr:uncharacterized protein TRIVIDRAFT_67754 [Trichoderma virens Gv29-8]EHK24131.1 hypothetical protein TRIVIDRAFT_67754 [Trichoderma virens Gv29-8]
MTSLQLQIFGILMYFVYTSDTRTPSRLGIQGPWGLATYSLPTALICGIIYTLAALIPTFTGNIWVLVHPGRCGVNTAVRLGNMSRHIMQSLFPVVVLVLRRFSEQFQPGIIFPACGWPPTVDDGDDSRSSSQLCSCMASGTITTSVGQGLVGGPVRLDDV